MILTMWLLTGTDAQTVRPYTGLHVLLYHNGGPPTRHFRASLQRLDVSVRPDLVVSPSDSKIISTFAGEPS